MGLCYNVLRENVNSKSIEFWNVFNHGKFKEAAEAYLAGELTEDELRREACYYFWSKCEYEVIVCGWPNQETKKKLDIYDQLIANWFVFMNYLNSKAICSWG